MGPSRIRVWTFVAGVVLTPLCAAATEPLPLYRYVDPRIGNGNDNQGDTVPGPTRPAGSIHPSPETLVGSNAGYDKDAPLSGFAQLDTQGSGGRTTYGTFLVSPQAGDPLFEEDRHLSPKADEQVEADHYAVTLARFGQQKRPQPTRRPRSSARKQSPGPTPRSPLRKAWKTPS